MPVPFGAEEQTKHRFADSSCMIDRDLVVHPDLGALGGVFGAPCSRRRRWGDMCCPAHGCWDQS